MRVRARLNADNLPTLTPTPLPEGEGLNKVRSS